MIGMAQFTITDLCDPVVAGTAPTSPVQDMLWLDTSPSPAALKRWNGSAWEAVSSSVSGGRNLLLDTEDERSKTRASSNVMIDYEFSPLLQEMDCTTFIFSFEAKADVEGMRVDFYFRDDSVSLSKQINTVLSLEYARYTQLVTLNAGYTTADIKICRFRINNGSGTVCIQRAMLERGNTASDWVCAPEDDIEHLELKLADVHAQINTSADSIRQEVQANYAAANEVAQLTEQLTTLSEQSESNFTWSVSKITELQTGVTAAQEATAEQIALLQTYMTFSESGLIIGKTGNPFTFRVVNDRLAFYMNNTEVAYLSNNKLYVTQAEILTRLQIGKFAFEPQSNGNLSVIYTG